jgi:shikimate dehydrogenase
MINTQTELYGVIGDPIGHSLSPVMHNSAFAEIGYNGAYMAFHVTDIANAIKGIRALGVKGLSVTIPHKVSIMEHLDTIDEQAVKIGAVNTVVNKDGNLYGYNSDCLGAMDALKEVTPIKDQKVVIIGAGGAARAIGFGVLAEKGDLTIVNILEDEGTALAKDLNVPYFHLSEFNQVEYDILIHSTPVGMAPNINKMPVEADDLLPDTVVMDIVYNPLQTKLLQEASIKNCKPINGVAMFVYQGVSQFETWTGEKAPVDVMKQAVLYALTKNK